MAESLQAVQKVVVVTHFIQGRSQVQRLTEFATVSVGQAETQKLEELK